MISSHSPPTGDGYHRAHHVHFTGRNVKVGTLCAHTHGGVTRGLDGEALSTCIRVPELTRVPQSGALAGPETRAGGPSGCLDSGPVQVLLENTSVLSVKTVHRNL